MRGVSGSLLSLDVLRASAPGAAGLSAIRLIVERAHRTIGPTSAARRIYDQLVVPLFEAAGRELGVLASGEQVIAATREPDMCVGVGGWGQPLRRIRDAAMAVVPRRPRWWLGTNGLEVQLLDNSTAFSGRYLAIDLEGAVDDEATVAGLACMLSTAGVPPLDVLVTRSHTHRSAVAASLQVGVETSLAELVSALAGAGRTNRPMDEVLAEALTIVYRILFLLFAEARGLVPQWHPTYRRSYTIESLRPAIEEGRRVRGLWPAIQAISRLAHRGCRAGTLRVTPFNGRLFAPSGAPRLEQVRLDDGRVGRVLRALTTRRELDRRARISYADLGVEQLGAVYERVLEFVPVRDGRRARLARSARRKSTGTFYTPRPMTEYLVRRTLAPLVAGRRSADILDLKIVDPAMGSGAFLVAACRYLAVAYQEALTAEGHAVDAAERAGFRRVVAQRCLYGVDVNPMAVQLARLSLWLCTLTSDEPLTFLDHHLRVGNSLVGASPADVSRQPPAARPSHRRAVLPLFGDPDVTARLGTTVSIRVPLALVPDDSAEAVREKERTMSALDGANAPLAALRRTCDAWCAAWFWPAGVPRIAAASWPAFVDALAGAASTLPLPIAEAWRNAAATVALERRFFHWELEFPEVFYDADGGPLERPGFDAVIGNPPWEALRGDCGSADEKRDAKVDGRVLTAFTRESGCYRSQGDGHANLYHLFAERMVGLTRTGGRAGLLMPSGLMSDHGSRHLREMLFRTCTIDALLAFDNRQALFPIHRGVRFVLLTLTRGGTTRSLNARFAIQAPAVLDDVPDRGPVPGAIEVPMALVERFGGDALTLPDLPGEIDRVILAGILSRVPALTAAGGWGVRVGRELNASDDRRHFGADGLPIVEGKHVHPFRTVIPTECPRIAPAIAAARLGGRPFERMRLGYREVASATNRLTLIAAMIPAGTVTTHTVFTVRDRVPEQTQWFLCGMFNSLVANYLVRLRGGTHVTAAAIHALPVPRPAGADAIDRVAHAARALARRGDEGREIELQVAAARLYGLSPNELAHVLTTFPLLPESFRTSILRAYSAAEDAI